jgi:peptidoglycan/LPS O-acetylase OafA/YrhL
MEESSLASALEPVTIERVFSAEQSARATFMRSTHQDQLAIADAFRAVAILGVVASHLALVSGLHLLGPRDDLSYLGAWGVNCFFVLSGFLLSRPYLQAILGARAFPSTRLFLKRRFFRIYPLYAVAVIVSTVAAAVHAPHHLRLIALVSHLTFLHGISPVDIISLNGALWTMTVDAQFYLVLPLVAFVLAAVARKTPRPSGVTIIVTAIATAVVLSLVVRWYVFSHYPISIVHDPIGAAFVLGRNVIGMATAFALGMLLALLVLLGKQPNRVVASAIGSAGIVCFGVLACVARSYRMTTAYAICYDALAAISAALILYGFAEGAFNVVDVVRRSRLITSLAALSYAVYLFHSLIIDTVVGTLGKHAHWILGSAGYVLGLSIPVLIATFIVAYLGHRFVEKPFLELRDRNREVVVQPSMT